MLAHVLGWCCSGSDLPDSAGLEVGRSAGENSGGQRVARLTTVHHTLGHRGEISRAMVLTKGLQCGEGREAYEVPWSMVAS